MIGILCLLHGAAAAKVEISPLGRDARNVSLHRKFELTFTLSRVYANPFDVSEVDITVQFVQPDGSTVTVPAFFYQDYDYVNARLVNGRNPCWKVRFAPAQTGTYQVSRIAIVDAAGLTTVAPQLTFTALPASDGGIVRRDSRDPSYLRHASGRPYLPIGHNVGWPRGGGLAAWQRYVTAMGAAGENWTRMYLTHYWEGQTLEWSSNLSSDYHGVGRLSLEMGWKLDRMIEGAEEKGIAIQLVLQDFLPLSTTSSPSQWSENPYNPANAAVDGGFLRNPEDFFTDPAAIRLTKNKYRYIVARWGYSPAIFAWELFNEVEWTDGWQKNRPGVVAWHKEMAHYLASVDPFDHLITTSSDTAGFEDLWKLDDIDVLQVHYYGTETPSFISAMTARLARYRKPVLLAEFGVGEAGPPGTAEANVGAVAEPYQTQLREALELHNGIWAAFHRKSGAHLWCWDYVEALDLYGEFVALSRYAQGEDPAACRLSKANLDTTGLPRRVLVSPGVTGFYDQSTQAFFTVRPDGTVPGTEGLSMWLHGSSKDNRALRSDPTFTLDLTEGDVLRIRVQKVSGSGKNSLRVLVDGEHVFSSTYPNGAIGFTIEVPLPAGEHAVKIENTGQDWFLIDSYEFINPSKGCLEFIGLSGPDHAYLWVHDVGSSFGRTASGVFSGVSIVLRGLTDGFYVADFYETRNSGDILQSQIGFSKAGRFVLRFPPFARDVAVKIKPVDLFNRFERWLGSPEQ